MHLQTRACCQTHVAASLQARLCACVVGAGTERLGAAGWMKHRGFGVDTSEACHPVRPSQALSGSVQVKFHKERNVLFTISTVSS